MTKKHVKRKNSDELPKRKRLSDFGNYLNYSKYPEKKKLAASPSKTCSMADVSPPEEKLRALVAEQANAIAFYEPANDEHMSALAKESGIIMLGKACDRAKWPVLVYKSNASYGFGLAASRLIRKDETIVPYLGEKYVFPRDEEPSKRQQAYAYLYDGDDTYILADKQGSVAVFANHNWSQPNIYCVHTKKGLVYKALFTIPKGSALLIDYGLGYIFEEPPVYLGTYENARTPAENLQENRHLYDEDPIFLTSNSNLLFKITNPRLAWIAPKLRSNPSLMQDKTKPEFLQSINLPVYLVRIGKEIMVLDKQPYLSTLMLACVEKNSALIEQLILNGADVFAETQHSMSVLNVATHTIANTESMALKKSYLLLLDFIHKKYDRRYPKEALEERFVAYVHQQVHDLEALKLISSIYPEYSFKSLSSLELEAPKTVEAEPKVETVCLAPAATPEAPIMESFIYPTNPLLMLSAIALSEQKKDYTILPPQPMAFPNSMRNGLAANSLFQQRTQKNPSFSVLKALHEFALFQEKKLRDTLLT